MSIAQAMLAEFEHESKITRKFLERVPQDKLTWKAHEKSHTVGALARLEERQRPVEDGLRFLRLRANGPLGGARAGTGRSQQEGRIPAQTSRPRREKARCPNKS